MERLDLIARHGRSSITLYDYFENGESSRKFLKDYALNEGKSIKQTVTSGSRKVWVCTSSTTCPWNIVLAKRQGKNVYKTKLSLIPSGKWYFHSITLVHSDLCVSISNPTSDQIKMLPGLQAALVEGCETSFKRVVESIRITHNLDVSGKLALVYRAIALEISRREAECARQIEYEELSSFLETFARNNLGSRTCCQLDSKGRFYRGFLSVGRLVQKQENLFPVFEVDGTHMKHKLYNGVCLILLGKDGDGGNVPLAIGFVHKETKWNFAWFFANCVASGIRLQDAALFSDRGKQLKAQKLLAKLGISIHVKFCTLHIVFNICHHFKSVDDDIQRVKPFVYKLQACTSLRAYEAVLGEIREEFPVPVKPNTTDELYVADYLHDLHPTCWTRFGNSKLSEEEQQHINCNWKNEDAYGSPQPLFGYRTTSGAEGENNALLLDGIRSVTVPESFRLFCIRILKVVKVRETTSSNWIKNKHTITPRAKALFDIENQLSPTVVATKTSPSQYYTVEHFSAPAKTKTFSVDLSTRECYRCPTAQMLRMPCRHILSALYARQINDGVSIADAVELCFHQAYTCNKFAECFSDFSLAIPVEADLDRKFPMKPPPRYRQAGGSVGIRRAAKDRAKLAKRIKSNGEVHTSRTSQVSLQHQAQASEMISVLSATISAATPTQRSEYKCSVCKSTDHNAKRCPNCADEMEERGERFIPGNYTVGGCPYLACGVPIGWVMLYVGHEDGENNHLS